LADERLVVHSHEDSNYGALKKAIFNEVKLDSKSVYPVDEELIQKPDEAAATYEAKIKAALGDKKKKIDEIENSDIVFDLVLLGMGEDGHTASLFPKHSLLRENKKLIASIIDSPKLPPKRITFTLPLINQAKQKVFVTTGSSKADILKTILESNDRSLPSQLVTNAIWFVDQDAAKQLSKI